MICGGAISGLVGLLVSWRNDNLTRRREQDSNTAKRLRDFRDDISAIVARLNRIPDDDAKQFNTDTRDDILILCARITADIPAVNKEYFTAAWACYCEMQDKDSKAATKFFSYIDKNPPLNPRDEKVENPFKDDDRPRKERMLLALQRLQFCAKIQNVCHASFAP